MDFFEYRNNRLYAEDVPVSEIASKYGTPAYVYSRRTIERHWHAFNDALGDHPHLICYAVKANGNPMVYRNQDTGWGWPPYFKFDTANLQTEAADLISTREAPKWTAITHYGWRNELFSIFPNATSIQSVSGPDARLIPWGSMIILAFLAGFALWVWRLWVRFKRRRIAPLVDQVDDLAVRGIREVQVEDGHEERLCLLAQQGFGLGVVGRQGDRPVIVAGGGVVARGVRLHHGQAEPAPGQRQGQAGADHTAANDQYINFSFFDFRVPYSLKFTQRFIR